MPRQGRNNTQMMHNTIAIRQETAADFTQVREVIRAAFQDIEESNHTEHLLVERLRQSDAYIAELSLVAETADGQIAGHIMLSKQGTYGIGCGPIVRTTGIPKKRDRLHAYP